ncbi:histidine--tRNA ligase, partial [Patescibacteria group bacterium]|nr:histidine--tRNA ligase [Patescibacteria group bacterium]
MAKLKYQTLTGMHDILPDDQIYFKKLNKTLESIARYYNLNRIDTPVLESADLFTKGTGIGTDIVEKEMYIF